MSKKILGKDIEPKCEICALAITAADGSCILCKKKGVCDFDDVCKKFVYDPLKRTPRRPAELVAFTDLDFHL